MWYFKYCNTILKYHKYYIKLYNDNSATNNKYEGWNFNSGNYLFTTDTK